MHRMSRVSVFCNWLVGMVLSMLASGFHEIHYGKDA